MNALASTDPSLFFTKNDPDDPRLGERVASGIDQISRGAAVIVGCPEERGVLLSKGRPGAADAPFEIRRLLYKMTTGARGELDGLRIIDAGDIVLGETPEETHDRLRSVTASIVRAGAVALVIGGGHDIAYGSVAGVHDAVGNLGVVNVDAHLDVRPMPIVDGIPRASSGTPFRRLIDAGYIDAAGYVVHGAQMQANSRAHVRFVEDRGGRIGWLDALPSFASALAHARGPGRSVHVSVDVDAAAEAFAPGVSAPSANGLDAASLQAIAYEAGQHPSVRALDIVEVAPPLDVTGKTARLAASLAIWFLAGLRLRLHDRP